MKLILGDCLEQLKDMEDNSVDSIVTDPPYGISFMSKKWDYDVPKVEVWKEVLRVLKSGGHMLCACGTRTQHRMAVNIEDAGFEIRDIVAWLYGSGFPKSHNIGKALDGLLGKQGKGFVSAGDDGRKAEFKQDLSKRSDYGYKFKPKSDNAKKFEGWGTALKPAMELWTLCRKPLEEKTIAKNVLKWGCGGINIDESRVGTEEEIGRDNRNIKNSPLAPKDGWNENSMKGLDTRGKGQGRFPANLIHDGSEEVVSEFPDTKSGGGKKGNVKDGTGMFGSGKAFKTENVKANSGSASRFFYCAKSSKAERNKGLEGFEEVKVSDGREKEADNAFQRGKTMGVNSHPTVKPIKLMQYLCRLVTPKGGTILDPYMGSGSTGIGAKLEGFDFIGIEMEEEYCKIAKARMEAWEESKQEVMF